jgi:viroplasmin and RNaseH domain-containing protein
MTEWMASQSKTIWKKTKTSTKEQLQLEVHIFVLTALLHPVDNKDQIVIKHRDLIFNLAVKETHQIITKKNEHIFGWHMLFRVEQLSRMVV